MTQISLDALLSFCNYGLSEETVIDRWVSEGRG